ncbi:HAUS augmin-like complex subunit 8 [Scleropages formosus]|uniref:HAUS augmin-like complex subunit 8 n=1 Tax=Scleropages formosus TaxID=113540 RepID=UPI000878023E|nr:HAUS augmin-like complex subunit 8 [Scleropages formosus]
MAARRVSTVRKAPTSLSRDSNDSKDGSQNNNSSSSGTAGSGGVKKKVPPVKSRYLQAVDRKQPAKNPVLNESAAMALQPASRKTGSGYRFNHSVSPRRSVASQSLLSPSCMQSHTMTSSILEPSQLGGNILQSTVLDGHCVHPDFDVSAVKAEKTVMPKTVEPENQKAILEMQTLMLSYLTAKMESNNKKLKAEAETNILLVLEEEEKMRKRVHEKKRQHLLLEKIKQLNSVLDIQLTALTPVATAVKQFTGEYKEFATAVDTTCHELPIKNFSIKGDRKEFLDKAKDFLQQSEKALLGYTVVAESGDDKASDFLHKIRGSAHELDDQLSRVFTDVLELSALVSRHTVQVQQTLEEEKLGMAKAQALYLANQ